MIFATEDEWMAAYDSALNELRMALDMGVIDCVPSVLPRLAQQVAYNAIRSALALSEADISQVRGIHVERITIERLPERAA